MLFARFDLSGIVVSARVHPGETNASWMMRGFLEFLLGDSKEAKILRRAFVFKIIPMLNPDGVIHGNYRCSLACVDLNRIWGDPSPRMHPTIYEMKSAVQRLMQVRPVLLMTDLHGHSRKMNIFMSSTQLSFTSCLMFFFFRYGCSNKIDLSKRLMERVFPRLLWCIRP